MQLMLLVITGLSLLLTAAMGAVLWTVFRAERLRSEARVALLRGAAGGGNRRSGDQEGQEGNWRSGSQEGQEGTRRSGEQEGEEGTGDQEIRRDRKGRRFAARGYRPAPASTRQADLLMPVPASGMFAAEAAPASPFRTSVLGGAALSAALLVLLALQLFGPSTRVAPASVPIERRPLELLALHHASDHEGLTISGLARNPAGGDRKAGVVVVASAIDASGREIGSGRAALDYVVLEPGSESPFVVKVAVAGAASRYRVRFRGTDGTIIAHVDRRTDDLSRHRRTIGGSPWVR